MGETLAWKKEEFAQKRPVYQRALDIIHATCQKYMDKLKWQEQIALPAYLKSIPRTMGNTTFTFAHFIINT